MVCVLERRNLELLILVVTFLKKLSIYKDNHVDMVGFTTQCSFGEVKALFCVVCRSDLGLLKNCRTYWWRTIRSVVLLLRRVLVMTDYCNEGFAASCLGLVSKPVL